MKFSDITTEEWDELRPYLDTCLLPVTGLKGDETPFEVTESLELLRDWMDEIEVPFRGRIVTYPAFHYINNEKEALNEVNDVCHKLKESGFAYVIVLSAQMDIRTEDMPDADLIVTPVTIKEIRKEKISSAIAKKVQELWRKSSSYEL